MRSDNKNQIPRTLLVGAFGPEVDRLVAGEAVPLGDQAAGVSRRRAFEVLEAGIGSVAAAVSVQARLLNPALPPITEILFLGSAGVYDAAVRGRGARFAYSTRFCKRDLAAIKGEARLPGVTGDVIESRPGVFARELTARRPEFVSGVTNSTDSVSLVSLQVTECDFENLEVYGIAYVCKRYEIDFAALLALTNAVGPDGSDEWRANYREMSLELQQIVLDSLTADDAGSGL